MQGRGQSAGLLYLPTLSKHAHAHSDRNIPTHLNVNGFIHLYRIFTPNCFSSVQTQTGKSSRQAHGIDNILRNSKENQTGGKCSKLSLLAADVAASSCVAGGVISGPAQGLAAGLLAGGPDPLGLALGPMPVRSAAAPLVGPLVGSPLPLLGRPSPASRQPPDQHGESVSRGSATPPSEGSEDVRGR